MKMKRSQEVRLIQESTLFSAPASESIFFANQGFGSKFPTMSDIIPISAKSFLAPNRAKRLKVTEAEKTHVQVLSTLKFKIKAEQNVKSTEGEPEPLSLSFFDSSKSPNEIKAMFDSKLYQMKSDIVSALKKMDTSFGCEVAAKIEFDDVDKSDGDPFIMKKILETSDIKNLSRLMLKKEWLRNHILPFWGTEQEALVRSETGLRVKIYDQDTDSYHALTLRRWGSNTCYVFNNKWKKSFVNRRGLQKGDKIGLYWDSFYSHFCFTVLEQPRQ